MNKILLLEDDVSLVDGLVYSLKKMNLMLKLPVLYMRQYNICPKSTDMIC